MHSENNLRWSHTSYDFCTHNICRTPFCEYSQWSSRSNHLVFSRISCELCVLTVPCSHRACQKVVWRSRVTDDIAVQTDAERQAAGGHWSRRRWCRSCWELGTERQCGCAGNSRRATSEPRTSPTDISVIYTISHHHHHHHHHRHHHHQQQQQHHHHHHRYFWTRKADPKKQGRGDGPKAGTSRASEAARAKQTPWTNYPLLNLTEINRPNEIEETGPGWAKAAWEQTSEAQSITPFIFLKFYSSLDVPFKSIFYFWRSGPVRELIPSYRSPRPCQKATLVLVVVVGINFLRVSKWQWMAYIVLMCR